MAHDHRWSVAEAKARLSRVLAEAQQAPQLIESRGRPVAVVVSFEAYRKLESDRDAAAPAHRWSEFLRLSERIREQGGAELEVPEREARPSPLA